MSSLPGLTARFSGRAVDFPKCKTPVSPLKLEDALTIPVAECSRDEEECRAARERGQFLARQDRWSELSDEIRTADNGRHRTIGGTAVADLLAYGARCDVVAAFEDALNDGRCGSETFLSDGIRGLEFVRQEQPHDPYVNMVVALAHIDMAWTWRGTVRETIIPRMNREKCAAHFDRARDLLHPWCGIELDSPLLQSTCCAMLAGVPAASRNVADTYEDLIDLDPRNPRHMRALGNHLLPRWFGTYQALELEARRTAARTHDIWGAGGYTWVCFDAIALDEEACAGVDIEFFVDGLRDIVRVCPGQETINLLAAYCTVTLLSGFGINEKADMARVQICNAADWLIRDHLTEIHPLIWAHAADGFANNMRISSPSRFAARGRANALQAIAHLFRDEIRRGNRVVFTPDGPQVHTA
ncbi:hypothetical protein [Ruegeria marina]|nr:hypothetical protein [Ruegeria marina]